MVTIKTKKVKDEDGNESFEPVSEYPQDTVMVVVDGKNITCYQESDLLPVVML